MTRLRTALLFFAASHALGLVTMALLLRPGMDPLAFSLTERAAYVASHSASWWLGWLPWRLAAVSNLWVGVELWRSAKSTARRQAGWALAWVGIAAVPEQWAEWRLVTTFVDGANGDLALWARDWVLYAGLTGVWASFGYTIAVAYFMQSAAELHGRPLVARWFEQAILAAFVVSGLLTLCTLLSSEPASSRWFAASGAVNGVAFPSLIVWSLLLAARLR